MFLILFALILLANGAYNANIACKYENKPPFYRCMPTTVDSITAQNQAITVSGTHISPYGNDNVTYIQFASPQTINYFPTLLFNSFKNLEHVQMRKVLFTTLTTDAITNCLKLKYFYLYDNNIPTIPASFMSTCTAAEQIHLYSNQITSVNKDAFSGLWYGREIDLSYNKITYIDPATFTPVGNLNYLYLGHNEITSIHPSTFLGNTVLLSVDLGYNKIKSLPALQLNSAYLQGVYFDSNLIEAVDPSFLTTYPGTKTSWILGLYDNVCIKKDFMNESPVQAGDLTTCYNTWNTWNKTTTVPPITIKPAACNVWKTWTGLSAALADGLVTGTIADGRTVYVGRASSSGQYAASQLLAVGPSQGLYFPYNGAVTVLTSGVQYLVTSTAYKWVASSAGAAVANAIVVGVNNYNFYVGRIVLNGVTYVGKVDLTKKQFLLPYTNNQEATTPNYEVLTCV